MTGIGWSLDGPDGLYWRELLQERGINDEVIDAMHIKPAKVMFSDPLPGESKKNFRIVLARPEEATGWGYSCYYPYSNDQYIVRWKRFDRYNPDTGEKMSASGMKALSPKKNDIPFQGEHPPFYVANKEDFERLTDAVRAQNGWLYNVEGEPGRWALLSAAVMNATSVFGAGSRPKHIVDYLKRAGVRHFVHIPDNDEAGIAIAHSLHDIFYDTGIQYYAPRIPEEFSDETGFLRELGLGTLPPGEVGDAFEDYIRDLIDGWKRGGDVKEMLEFPVPTAAKDEDGYPRINYYGDDLVDAIFSALGLSKSDINSNGFGPYIANFIDSKESDAKGRHKFAVSENGVGYDFRGGVSYSPREVALALGLNPEDYRNTQSPKQQKGSLYARAYSYGAYDSVPGTYNLNPLNGTDQFDYHEADDGNIYAEVLEDDSPQVEVIDGMEVVNTGVDENGSRVDSQQAFQSLREKMRHEITRVDNPLDIVEPRYRAIDRLVERVHGRHIMESQPIPFPIDDLQFLQLGGYATMIPRGKVVYVVAPSGGGKCVTSDTYIATGRGLVQIKNLRPDGAGNEFTPLSIDVQTPDGVKETSHFYDSGVQPTLRIETRYGYEVQGTYHHPVMTIQKGGEIIWKRLDEIVEGDFVAVHRPEKGLFGSCIKLPDYDPVQDGRYCDFTPPSELDEETAWFIGAMIGDGGLTQASPVFTSPDKALVNRVAAWAEGAGVNVSHRSRYDYVLNSVELRRWLGMIGLSGYAHEKKIPDVILQSPREIVRAALQGLFDTDGSAEAWGSKRVVSYCTTSKNLAEQIHLLLLQFGIISRKRFKCNTHRGAWIVEIRGEDIFRFRERVGFTLEKKAKRLDKLPDTFNTNVDAVPYLPEFKRLYQPDIFWSEVTSVEDGGEVQCYDLSVPDGHAFVAGGIVNHNTTAMSTIQWRLNSMYGLNTLYDGAEFSVDEYADMAIQQHTGWMDVVRLMSSDIYWFQKQNPEAIRKELSEYYGKPLTQKEMEGVIHAAHQIKGMSGESFVLKKPGMHLWDKLHYWDVACDYAASIGKPISAVFMDYAQLIPAPPDEARWDVNMSILAIKNWALADYIYTSPLDGVKRRRTPKVAYVASQVTKDASRNLKREGTDLTMDDSVGLRADYANLILMIQADDDYLQNPHNPRGAWWRAFYWNVVKNSKGSKMGDKLWGEDWKAKVDPIKGKELSPGRVLMWMDTDRQIFSWSSVGHRRMLEEMQGPLATYDPEISVAPGYGKLATQYVRDPKVLVD